MTLAIRPTGEIVDYIPDPSTVADILKDNLAGEDLSPNDLERIKIGTGGILVWVLPDGSTLELLEGVIIHQRLSRTYWATPFDESGGGSPPDCFVHDLRNKPHRGSLPEPKPEDRDITAGGSCAACPMNVFGSGKLGVGKACKESRLLFILRPDETGTIGEDTYPSLVSLGPGSLIRAKHYLTEIGRKGLYPRWIYSRLGLETANSSNGLKYSALMPLEYQVFSETGRATANELHEKWMELIDSVVVDRGDIDGPEGEGTSGSETPVAGETFYGHHVEEPPEITEVPIFNEDEPEPAPKTRTRKPKATPKAEAEATALDALLVDVEAEGWKWVEWEKEVLRMPYVEWVQLGQNAAKARIRWTDWTSKREIEQEGATAKAEPVLAEDDLPF